MKTSKEKNLDTLKHSLPLGISRNEIEKLKKEIIDYLAMYGSVYTSDLAIALNTEPRKIVFALKELKKEGLVSY